MVPCVTHFVVPKISAQSSHAISFKDSLQNEWTLHFLGGDSFLAIALEINSASTEITPVIGILQFQSKVPANYDFTHLFDKELPRSMEIRVDSEKLVDLYENNQLKVKVDIRVMQQVIPY